MSKAILILDEMPKHCMTCRFYDQMYFRCDLGRFENKAKFIKGDAKWDFKHENCPLKQAPESKEVKDRESLNLCDEITPDELENEFDLGYNQALKDCGVIEC